MADIIQLRRDTETNWTVENPTPSQGELCWEINTNKFKIGDGATAWASLPYLFEFENYVQKSVKTRVLGISITEPVDPNEGDWYISSVDGHYYKYEDSDWVDEGLPSSGDRVIDLNDAQEDIYEYDISWIEQSVSDYAIVVVEIDGFNINPTLWIYDGSSWTRSYNTYIEHVLESEDDYYSELTRDSFGRVTNEDVWETASKLVKKTETTITRTGAFVSSEVKSIYDPTGTYIISNITKTITRDSFNRVSSVTNTREDT